MKKYFIILLSFFSLIAFADFHNDENYYLSSYQSGPIIYDKNNEIKELKPTKHKEKKDIQQEKHTEDIQWRTPIMTAIIFLILIILALLILRILLSNTLFL